MINSDVIELLTTFDDLGAPSDGSPRSSQLKETVETGSYNCDSNRSSFLETLLYGSVSDAVDFAIKHRMWDHAFFLVQSSCPTLMSRVITW